MDEETKEKLEKGAEATAHGLGDIADVAGHIVAGTVKGAADGIEEVSRHSKEKQSERDDIDG